MVSKVSQSESQAFCQNYCLVLQLFMGWLCTKFFLISSCIPNWVSNSVHLKGRHHCHWWVVWYWSWSWYCCPTTCTMCHCCLFRKWQWMFWLYAHSVSCIAWGRLNLIVLRVSWSPALKADSRTFSSAYTSGIFHGFWLCQILMFRVQWNPHVAATLNMSKSLNWKCYWKAEIDPVQVLRWLTSSLNCLMSMLYVGISPSGQFYQGFLNIHSRWNIHWNYYNSYFPLYTQWSATIKLYFCNIKHHKYHLLRFYRTELCSYQRHAIWTAEWHCLECNHL